jgi:hypothetical protein
MLVSIGLLFSGCLSKEPKPSSENQDIANENRRLPVVKRYPGCKLLASGYLLCPKNY